MLTVRLKFPAENVLVDQQTQDVAAIGIIATGMKAVSYPVFLRRLCYLVFWDRSPEDAKDYDAVFSLKLGQTVIGGGAVTLNFGEDLSHRTLVRIEGVVIPQPGTLEFSLVVGGVTASYSVDVGTVQAAGSVVASIPS
jgi:hypothetical protein